MSDNYTPTHVLLAMCLLLLEAAQFHVGYYFDIFCTFVLYLPFVFIHALITLFQSLLAIATTFKDTPTTYLSEPRNQIPTTVVSR